MFEFRILETHHIDDLIPLMQKFTENAFSDEIVKQRFIEMFSQNYECAGILKDGQIIGFSGMWYCTRHYSGKSVEVDHVYIDDSYRGKGLGSQFLEWIYAYVKSEKNCESIELNTYVHNTPSHKFYYNQGFKILGFHFVKKL